MAWRVTSDAADGFTRGASGASKGPAPACGGGAVHAKSRLTGASTTSGESGFTDIRNHWYDPATGRFLTQDPIGLAGGVDLYAYAGNNPISFSDPFGLCPEGNCTQSQRHYNVDDAGVRFIQQEENTKLHTYGDQGGRPTIGTGHRLGTKESYPDGISAEEATELLQSDLGLKVQPALDKISNASLNQNQANAVGAFVFNAGQGAFDKSVLPSLNKGNTAGAAQHMGLFVKYTTKKRELLTSNGLVNRRTAELNLFNTVP